MLHMLKDAKLIYGLRFKRGEFSKICSSPFIFGRGSNCVCNSLNSIDLFSIDKAAAELL